MVLFEILPNETVYLILSNLILRRDLAAFCLISKNCRILGFSDLNRTMHLGIASHIELLTSRIANEDQTPSSSPTALRLSRCIHRLVFDDERYTSKYDREQLICDDVISDFASVIYRLTELESFAWRSHWLPRNTRIFKSLRLQCPKLCSVEFLNYHHDLGQEKPGYTESLYKFEDLKHMILTSQHVPITRLSAPPQIIQMIRLSPNLHTLELTLTSRNTSSGAWSPNKLFEALDLTFPNLRVVRLNGSLTNNWPVLFSKPCAFTSFFERHPALHTISIGRTLPTADHYAVAPDQMATLFPSLRHFEGPSFVCAAVVKSVLSSKLISMKILDRSIPSDWNSDDPGVTALCDLAENTRTLPALRSIGFLLDPGTRVRRALQQITQAAPQLRDLDIDGVSLHQLKVSETLKYAPNLRRIRVKVGLVSPNILRSLLDTCPHIKELHDTYKPTMLRSWSLSRRPDRSIELNTLIIPS